MIVDDIMIKDVISLTPEDTVSKALNLMHSNRLNQIPIVNDTSDYLGMVFAKEFLSVNAYPDAKLKNFVSKTQTLGRDVTVERAIEMILNTGNRAFPVIESNSKLVGIVSEMDIVVNARFGHATADSVMSGAIVQEGEDTLGNALSKMRRYNISRLPVINRDGVLTGIVNVLDIAHIISKPRERASKSPGVGTMAVVRDVKVKDMMRNAYSVEQGSRIDELTDDLKDYEEVVVIGNNRPIGVVTPKDALELLLPKHGGPNLIHISDPESEDDKNEIEKNMTKFLKKIEGRLENIQLVTIYVDKHKTRKYSIRARIMTNNNVIDAKAVAYDPISASKEIVSKLERRIKSAHSSKLPKKHRRGTIRKEEF
jgi:CBS-domain-containing membrane protein/ribosome-associated translation inhibitor RaiA